MSNINDEFMFIKKRDIEIAKILVGTSPFIAAGQFEKRLQYHMEFVIKRGNIAEIISWCLLNGFPWIQVLDVDFVVDEIDIAYKRTGVTPIIVLSTWNKPERIIDKFKHFDLRIILIHASLVDTLDLSLIRSFIKRIENLGFIPGIATHIPNVVLPYLKDIEGIKAVMVPLNYAGLFNDKVEETFKLLREMKVVVIAKKVLGAGRLPIDKALRWALSRPEIDSLALGIASITEAKQTLNLARDIIRETQ